MRGIFIALAGAVLLAAAPAAAQDASKSIQLSKVILDTSNPIKGKIKGGTLCVFPTKWDVAGEKKTQDYERYDVLFSDRMKQYGFNPVTTSADLFAGEDDKNKADYLIGATMRPDTINLCSSVSGFKGNMILGVEWQVYDRAERKVVATVTTSGEGAVEKFAQDGMTTMWNRAFNSALDKLVTGGTLQPYIGAPTSAPKPEPVPVPTPKG